MELIAFLQTPLGAAVLVIAAWAIKKYVPALLPLLQRIVPSLPSPTPSPAPVDPVVPLVPAVPQAPLLDAALEVLKALAKKQFPWLSQEQALLSFAQKSDRDHEEKKAADAKAAISPAT